VTLAQGLSPGAHVLRAEVLDVDGETVTASQPVALTVVETVVPKTGSNQLPWPTILLVALALLGLALVFTLGGATLRAWERTRRH
jgi:hypothetical protein